MTLPDLLPVSEIQVRLQQIFPEGVENRVWLTRNMAARVVYVMLYIGAIEGEQHSLGPKHVYAMSDRQMARASDIDRLGYAANAWRSGYKPKGRAWYADTTREPIRDETLRDGLMRVGAAAQRPEVPTTSSLPRYALRREFAELFDPSRTGVDLEASIQEWQQSHLNQLALARIQLLRQGAGQLAASISVSFPNGAVRQLAPGPSSLISKAVIETFAPKFLYKPAVVLLSESRTKIITQDDTLSRSIGLHLKVDRLLPDIILFDLEPDRELLVIVEVVATSGPISQTRKTQLLGLARGANIAPRQIAFVNAYRDRNDSALRRTFGSLAWNSFAWFMSEPNNLVVLRTHPSLGTGRILEPLD